MNDKLICEYCGNVKQEVSFVIGASNDKEWVMNEGTGKVSCPDCWEIGRKEGQGAIDKHIKNYNQNAIT